LKKKYSHLIKSFQIIIDVFIINSIVYLIYDKQYLNVSFLSYITIFWLLISYFVGFYKVYRYTRFFRLFTLLVKQFFLLILGYFAYFGVFREGDIVNNQFLILTSIIISISLFKFFWFFILNKYRSFGNNYRTTVVVGFDNSSKDIVRLFKSKSNLGYKYLGYFSDKVYSKKEYLGNLESVLSS
jgi:putative colanic acid biosynthesis UDP-glucose lipid carrier transferase